jgi:hypothetical protein
MASMTDFQAWLDSGNDPETDEDKFCLWRAANGEGMGPYEVSGDDEKRFIKGPSQDTLALVSAKSIAAFKKHLNEHYQPELGWEGAYIFERGMQKDD